MKKKKPIKKAIKKVKAPKLITKTFTVEQWDAIKSVFWNLDELDNKQRRLYSALRQFIIDFNSIDVANPFELNQNYFSQDKQSFELLDTIDEAERMFYNSKNAGHLSNALYQCIGKVKKELLWNKQQSKWKQNRTEEQFNSFFWTYQQAVEEATSLLGKEMIQELIDNEL